MFLNFNSIAQCCSAGNPVGGDGTQSVLNKNDLSVNLYFKHSLSKDYYHLDKKTKVPYEYYSYYDFNYLSLTYGLFPRLSLYSELGYFYNKTQQITINNEKEIIRSNGLGDLLLSFRYRLIQTVKPVSQLIASCGIKIPVGPFNEEIDGIIIPVSLQPSSGAFKLNTGLFYSRKRLEKKTGWYSFVFFEYSNIIEKGYLTYKYGNFFQFSLAGTYSILKNLTAIGSIKMEWREKDKREVGIKIESSGSKIVYFCPQVLYIISNKWYVTAIVDLPFYKYINGYQLTNKLSYQLGIRKDF